MEGMFDRIMKKKGFGGIAEQPKPEPKSDIDGEAEYQDTHLNEIK